MGFKRERIYKLVFEDAEYEGLEVKARSVSIGSMRRILALSESEADTGTVFEMTEEFSKALVSWNLEDEADQPVPANLAGLETQDSDFVMEIIGAWISAISSVADASPLDDSSTSGKPSPAVSIPMEPLSESLAS